MAELVPGGPDVEVVPDLLVPQVPIIAEVLSALGIATVGRPEYEADDIIGTLAATAAGPVDVVTGDRDLFQVVDDSRGVRVVYTARGMSNLEIVTDDVLRSKYGVTAVQYADFAALRGDASDGLPGVAGIGEKTAASLLAEFGSLDGIIRAAADSHTALSARVREKIRAADDYLARARAVVAVARDLELPAFHSGIGIPHAGRDELERLRARWGLGDSLGRAVSALDLATQAPSAK